jgi:23S rRNA pseudouridine1911/1915/1917 synthase
MRTFDISISKAQKMIDTRQVLQNGRPITDKAAVVQGEIEVVRLIPCSLGIDPLFETPRFAVFEKPSGLKVHPRSRKSGPTLVDEVRYRYGPDANIVHRIDKETSGLVLASKDKATEKRLKSLFEGRRITKRYMALVRGRLEGELLIDAPILKNADFSDIKLKVFVDERGRPAQTIVRPLAHYPGATLVEAIPLTGRQHQIRAHLFHVKHPIIGDPIYGVDAEVAKAYLEGELSKEDRVRLTGAPRLMLHAYGLEFEDLGVRYMIYSKDSFRRECALLFKDHDDKPHHPHDDSEGDDEDHRQIKSAHPGPPRARC